MDTTEIGNLALEAMGYAESVSDNDDAYVRTVAVVVEVDCGDSVLTHVVCSDDRLWGRVAFLEHAITYLHDLDESMREDAE